MVADEISALVVDVGNYTTKAGYSGEDTPRALFRTSVGQIPQSDDVMDTEDAGGSSKYRFGEDAQVFVENMEIKDCLENGLVCDWEQYHAVVDHALSSRLRTSAEESPLVFCEPSFNTSEQRMKLAELVFEKFNTPAFFVSKRGVLSAFATGKSTALVVDVGHKQTVVTPVYDGYAIKKAIVTENIGGDMLTKAAVKVLEARNVNLTPHFKILRKKAVEFGKPAEIQLKKLQHLTHSFDLSAKMRVATDFKETVCAVSDTVYNESVLSIRPQKQYEFPSGYNGNFGAERFKIPELLFNPNVETLEALPESFTGLAGMIQNALNSVDVDVRPHLLSNVVLVGGSSSFLNFADRLNNELVRHFPGSKIRLYAPGSTAERRFSSWIGGSILSSLGTFQQLWISKQDYEENGGSIVDKQCA